MPAYINTNFFMHSLRYHKNALEKEDFSGISKKIKYSPLGPSV
jgi:hypothetical protein